MAAIAGLNEQQAVEQLNRCNGEVKTAIVAAKRSIAASEARTLLERSEGKLRLALELKA